jgi:cell fate (sporulation/competence/biofilm development) regulator YlbF (YheA/YmcA/DUF963 family)
MADTALLEDKAKDLGRMLGQSTEYQALKRANESLTNDRDAVTLLRQMETLRQDAQRMIERGEEPTPDMEQQLDALLSQLQTNTGYQRAVAAQENFDKLMMRVNEWIGEGIRKGATSSIITLG